MSDETLPFGFPEPDVSDRPVDAATKRQLLPAVAALELRLGELVRLLQLVARNAGAVQMVCPAKGCQPDPWRDFVHTLPDLAQSAVQMEKLAVNFLDFHKVRFAAARSAGEGGGK